VIEKKFGAPIITKDGVTVTKEIELQDPLKLTQPPSLAHFQAPRTWPSSGRTSHADIPIDFGWSTWPNSVRIGNSLLLLN
jgi:hypothetical protein